jgi:hypothetical protein
MSGYSEIWGAGRPTKRSTISGSLLAGGWRREAGRIPGFAITRHRHSQDPCGGVYLDKGEWMEPFSTTGTGLCGTELPNSTSRDEGHQHDPLLGGIRTIDEPGVIQAVPPQASQHSG